MPVFFCYIKREAVAIQGFHLTHSVLACGFVNGSPALLPVLSLCPGQVLFCHQDQVAAAPPSVSVAARGDTPSAKWISLIGRVIYRCFALLGIMAV